MMTGWNKGIQFVAACFVAGLVTVGCAPDEPGPLYFDEEAPPVEPAPEPEPREEGAAPLELAPMQPMEPAEPQPVEPDEPPVLPIPGLDDDE